VKSKNGFDFVLDCSVTMAWLFEDETTTETEVLLQKLETLSAIVPSIWPHEVANVLAISIRKKRIEPMQASSFIDSLSALSIHVDDSTTQRPLHSVFNLAMQEGLTIYDAAYLELAIRENIPFATRDQDLIKASKKLKIPLI